MYLNRTSCGMSFRSRFFYATYRHIMNVVMHAAGHSNLTVFFWFYQRTRQLADAGFEWNQRTTQSVTCSAWSSRQAHTPTCSTGVRTLRSGSTCRLTSSPNDVLTVEDLATRRKPPAQHEQQDQQDPAPTTPQRYFPQQRFFVNSCTLDVGV